MDELKPCPFCGGEARFKVWGNVAGVECDRCGIGTHTACIDEYQNAIDAWNTRAERTCTNVWDKEPEPKCDNGFKCSLCGYSVSDGEDWRVFTYEHEENGCVPWDCVPWRYCPGCGAKVVER